MPPFGDYEMAVEAAKAILQEIGSSVRGSSISNSAFLSEIFSSIQGEGLYVGVRQVFVRFAGCNLTCSYCDTPASRFGRPETCSVQGSPDESVFHSIANPLDVSYVASQVIRLESMASGHHSVSLTGGEPLMQAPFLLELCPELRKSGRLIYLESNGTLVGAMEDLLPYVDIVAMDFKLESATGIPAETEMHREFLTAVMEKDVFVKAVVDSSTLEEEVEECAAVIALVNRRIPLVIQPATSLESRSSQASASRLGQLQVAAARILEDVRVIPQCHKLVGLL